MHLTNPNKPKQREAVLTLAHYAGPNCFWLEHYSEDHIDHHTALVPAMETPEGERLAQEYIELCLPKRYRDLYRASVWNGENWVNKQRAAQLITVVRPSDIARRDWELDLLKSIDQAGELLCGVEPDGVTQ